MKVTMKMEGLSRCQAALRELPAAVGREVVLEVLTARAEPIAGTAQELAPVAEGHLRDSIKVSQLKSRGGDHAVSIHTGMLPQSVMQEYGTKRHPPQPFMRPAWDRHIDKVLENIVDDLSDAIGKALSRHLKRGA